MVLDEPTNDLDMDSLDLLQEMIADYAGTVLLVSHDRNFLDRTVTSTIAIEDGGAAMEYPGGYSDYLRQRPQITAGGRPSSKRDSAGKPKTKPIRDAPRIPRRKLSYNQQRALEQLPDFIATLESRIEALEATLADSGLYSRDRDAFERAGADLAAARETLSATEDEWLELQILRDAIDSDR